MKQLIPFLFFICLKTFAYCEDVDSTPFFQGSLDNNLVSLGTRGHTLSLAQGRIDSDIVWSDSSGEEIYRLQTRKARTREFSRYFYVLKDCQGVEVARVRKFRSPRLRVQKYLVESQGIGPVPPHQFELVNRLKDVELPQKNIVLKKFFKRGTVVWRNSEQSTLSAPETLVLALQFFREIDTDWDSF